MQPLRDLATHRPDDVLINLNYPAHLRTHLHGGRVIDADNAALAVVAAEGFATVTAREFRSGSMNEALAQP